MWKEEGKIWNLKGDWGNVLLQTQRLSFVEMGKKKKKPEAELGGFEGLQMQPAET